MRDIAHALGLLKHNWYWDDPENGDIWCSYCKIKDYTQTKPGPCPDKPIPSKTNLLKLISRKQRKIFDQWVQLEELKMKLNKIR